MFEKRRKKLAQITNVFYLCVLQNNFFLKSSEVSVREIFAAVILI